MGVHARGLGCFLQFQVSAVGGAVDYVQYPFQCPSNSIFPFILVQRSILLHGQLSLPCPFGFSFVFHLLEVFIGNIDFLKFFSELKIEKWQPDPQLGHKRSVSCSLFFFNQFCVFFNHSNRRDPGQNWRN